MRLFRLIIVSFLCIDSLVSFAQINDGIVNIQGVYTKKFPGNIPVNDKGKLLFGGADTLITIYAETSGKGPEWKMAWWGGKNYSIISMLILQTPYEAGTNARDEKKIILNPANGNKLWRLSLQSCEKKIDLPQKIKPGQLLLKAKYLDKTIFRKIDSLVQLTTFPSV